MCLVAVELEQVSSEGNNPDDKMLDDRFYQNGSEWERTNPYPCQTHQMNI